MDGKGLSVHWRSWKVSSLYRAVIFRRNDTSDNNKNGPLGLNIVSQPAEKAVGDIVFIHGLGGGSRKTWSKHADAKLFWPQAWLSQDPAFQDVRIHTFGYDANWGKESILNIHDFAKSLLYALKDCPSIPKDHQGPIVFVCHSLGGLVAKQAFILARQLKEYEDLGHRIRCIFFLATPHRGSDMAELLSRILQITPTTGPRPFVSDLHPNSAVITAINDAFPHHCRDLQLHSFYETKSMNLWYRKTIIVPKDSAVLGYENERSTYLNANHREVCKFRNHQDPNYQSIRNSLASTLDNLRRSQTSKRHDTESSEQQWLKECLDVDDAYEDEYHSIDTERVHGSCEWITETAWFQDWLQSSLPQLYWLSAKPGAGKSVLSSFIITYLRQVGNCTSFYFFRHSDNTRSSIGCLLRSVAWQLSLTHQDVFNLVMKICRKDPQIPKADYRSVWRKLFLEGIFRLTPLNGRYLVIDAIDECKNHSDLVPLLVRAAELNTLRVLVTSRDTFESYGVAHSQTLDIISETMPHGSIMSDIRLYVAAHVHSLPVLGKDRQKAQNALIDSILDKSSACFLWVRLVIDELRRVHTEAEVRKVLQDIPSDMDHLYMRILDSMSTRQYGKRLTKAILTWTTCATRPLSTDELHQALQIDLNDTIDSMERLVRSNCGQLVCTDTSSRVQIIHQTAREFLLQPQNESEFAFEEQDGHKRLALVCLKYLCGDDMSGPKSGKLNITANTHHRSPFVNYASQCLADHINHVASEDDDLIPKLAQFFRSRNVLAWIEFIAANEDLERLVHTGRVLQKFLQRRETHGLIHLSRDIATLDAWAIDLTRLVTKFGRNLSLSPSSIYKLIPPFCPSETALKRQFGTSNRSLLVSGLSSQTWDDCSAVIAYPEQSPSSIACSSALFAVGLAKGDIVIHHANTSLEFQRLAHGERIQKLQFGESGNLLASVAFESICIWSTDSWQRLWKFQLDAQCLDLKFLDSDQTLLVILQNNCILLWNTATGNCQENHGWLGVSGEGSYPYSKHPEFGAIAGNSSVLAVVSRGEDIMLWDIENDITIGFLGQDGGFRGAQAEKRCGVAFVRNMVFSCSPDSGLLAASYIDGELVVYNIFTKKIQARAYANAHTLVSSPDGLMLACGNTAGMMLVFEFETLKMLYCSPSDKYGVNVLGFSADSDRLFDVRGHLLRVWEPPVLVPNHQDTDELTSGTVSISGAPQDYNVGNPVKASHISAFVCIEDHNVLICGRLDGTILIFDGKTGEPYQEAIQKSNNVSIKHLIFDPQSSVLISGDIYSRISSYRLIREKTSCKAVQLFLQKVEGAVMQITANPGCSRVLISTWETDTLFEFDAQGMTKLQSISWHNRHSYRWITHPTNGAQLILMIGQVVHLYDWQSLQRLTSDTGIKLVGLTPPELEVRSIVPCFDGGVIATTTRNSYRSRSKVFLWNTRDLSVGSETVAPIPHSSPALADQIECVVGNLGRRVVVLRHDGWICSTESHDFGVDSFDRHFFFPADWLCATGGLLLGMFRNGNIAFVQRDEVAIIQRGMKYSDTGQARGVWKRPSLARTVRSDTSVPESRGATLSLGNV